MNKTREVRTSLTLDYRKEKWGIERIVLDTIANHLPADSKGKNTLVRLKQDGKYVDLRDADPKKETEEVVFEDDGGGFDVGYLDTLVSSKGADRQSIGQFGEGLKLAATASIRHGLEVEYHSKNWTAKPLAKPEKIGEQDIERLYFEITENGYNLQGSRTIFRNLSKEFLAEIFRIPNKVLVFNDNYEVLFKEKVDETEYAPQIISLKGRGKYCFVKGMKITTMNSLFSYDLALEEISPDRIHTDEWERKRSIQNLLIHCDNPAVLEKILENAETKKDSRYEEFEVLRYVHGKPKNAQLWLSMFRQLFGENAVLSCDNEDLNKDAQYAGHKVMHLDKEIADFLKGIGVETAEDIQKQERYLWVDEDDMSEEEKEKIRVLEEITGLFTKKPVSIGIYHGKESVSGRKVKCNPGVYIPQEKKIGLHREIIEDPLELFDTYIHELDHHVTGAGDYDRAFSGFLSKLSAVLLMGKLKPLCPKIFDDSVIKAKEGRLAGLIEKTYEKKNGNRLRQIAKAVAGHYEDMPDRLHRYFIHDNEKLAGIAASAYFMLTEEIEPIQKIEYGGLGVTIEDSGSQLEFKRNQLHFARIKGGLSYSKNSDNALWHSENSRNALWHSGNSGNALWYSENLDFALRDSENSGMALKESKNSEYALKEAKNSEGTLQGAEKIKRYSGPYITPMRIADLPEEPESG